MPKGIKKRIDVRKTVQKEMQHGLDFVDSDHFSSADLQAYAQQAKMILASPVWQQETKRLIVGWIEHIAATAENYDQVLDARMSINGVKVLQERLEFLAAREGIKQTLNDPFAGV